MDSSATPRATHSRNGLSVMHGRVKWLAVLVAALTIAAAPLHAEDTTTALELQRIAFDGDLDGAINRAMAAFASKPRASTGRVLQDLLQTAGRAKERKSIILDAHPELLRRGLEARIRAPKQAAAALTALLKTDGAAPCFRLDLALAQLAAGKPAAARAAADSYTEAFPQVAEGHLVLARVLLAQKKTDNAREALDQVVALEPGHPEATSALLALGGEMPATRRQQLLAGALRLYPNNAEMRLAHAEQQISEGKLEAATKTLLGILELPSDKSAIYTRLAEVWRLRRDYKKSGEAGSKALAVDSITKELRIRALRARGFAKQKQDDLDGARKDFQAALMLNPDSAQLNADHGFALALAGKLEDARVRLERAIRLDKKLMDAHLKYGVALYLDGESKGAKKEFSLVLKNDANNIPANRYMGYLLLQSAKPKPAIEHFLKVAELDPKDSSSMRMVGRAEMALGKLDAAMEAFRAAINRNDKDGFAHFDMGKAHEKKSDFESAEAAYRKAIEVEEKLTYPHLYLAELVHYINDKPDEAIPHYERYLELGGEDEDKAIENLVKQLKEK